MFESGRVNILKLSNPRDTRCSKNGSRNGDWGHCSWSCGSITMISSGSRISRGAPTPMVGVQTYNFWPFVFDNCTKLKTKCDQEGARIPSAPLEPPMMIFPFQSETFLTELSLVDIKSCSTFPCVLWVVT